MRTSRRNLSLWSWRHFLTQRLLRRQYLLHCYRCPFNLFRVMGSSPSHRNQFTFRSACWSCLFLFPKYRHCASGSTLLYQSIFTRGKFTQFKSALFSPLSGRGATRLLKETVVKKIESEATDKLHLTLHNCLSGLFGLKSSHGRTREMTAKGKQKVPHLLHFFEAHSRETNAISLKSCGNTLKQKMASRNILVSCSSHDLRTLLSARTLSLRPVWKTAFIKVRKVCLDKR